MTAQNRCTRRGFLAAAGLPRAVAAPERPPNVVVIFADNLGYGDAGCYGSIIRTPHIDRLAAEGMRFTDAYAASPICSPSRAALLTGRYPFRVGVPKVLGPQSTDGLPDSETTIAQMLKARGYKTACFGKWHLGHLPAYLPMRRGFDEFFGTPYSPDMAPFPLLRGAGLIEQPARLDALTAQITAEAVRFIEQSRNSPFFLYLPETAPHPPQAASARFRGKSPAGLYGDMVEEMDWSVGEVMAALRQHGLDRNTLVFFTSDNGPMNLGSAGPFRGRIGSTYEGGVREPYIAWWPGRIPAGRVNDSVVSTLDILPTVARVCGAKAAAPLDGVDIWPVLSGARPAVERDVFLYSHRENIQCARLGRYKLHLARYGTRKQWVSLPLRPLELYDVVRDPGECYDIAPEHPGVVREIQDRAERLIAGMPESVRRAWTETQAQRTAFYQIGSPPEPANQ